MGEHRHGGKSRREAKTRLNTNDELVQIDDSNYLSTTRDRSLREFHHSFGKIFQLGQKQKSKKLLSTYWFAPPTGLGFNRPKPRADQQRQRTAVTSVGPHVHGQCQFSRFQGPPPETVGPPTKLSLTQSFVASSFNVRNFCLTHNMHTTTAHTRRRHSMSSCNQRDGFLKNTQLNIFFLLHALSQDDAMTDSFTTLLPRWHCDTTRSLYR